APTEIRHARWNERPVGNGPFRFVRHDPNRRWVFEANPAFPPSLGGRPRLDRLVVAVVDEPMTKLAALTAGELDFAGIQPAHADFVRRDPDLAVVDYPLFFSYAVVFNARRPPFDRVEVRRALGLALDRTAIVSGYLFGFGEPAAGPRSTDASGAQFDAPVYAPGRARAILGDTLAFELVTVGSGEAALEQMIQQQLARINVKVTIRQLELATFLERVQTGHEFDAAVMGISGDREGGYLRSLLDLTGLPVPASGVDLFRYYADSVPVSFLYHARGVQGMNRRIDGVRMDLRGELPTVTRWVAR
ncbi:MAG: ABC transporter substrate-binding protein, partial [Gemmatimonadales bacterium]|nr:ABC transporter substrate-binding protein [Gemmatimonadales bacterium]